MDKKGRKKTPKPLDETRLRDFALNYVGRYATSRQKLQRYLQRKIFENGWAGERPADVDTLLSQFEELGYIDDEQYAHIRAGSLSRRGYGEQRIAQDLHHQGIAPDITGPLLEGQTQENPCEDDVWGAGSTSDQLNHARAAVRYARKKRLGPFADVQLDMAILQKQIAKLVRAGHSFALARSLLEQTSGFDVEEWLQNAPSK